ncbi:MAG: large subunit ribosomal protein L10e [Candidatus Methanomethylophilaceae archaeon]|nr:large subunit ribosomal protein L10e [Candidatus Methanomethylophilaceae archaeon]MDI3541781.1 large subunit ribosomal protein L10e [Candidatus Methanomethylophilaceae archaeon]HIJ00726.1 50S ribosomal protein L16 [Candidatus Methanomethylophilaceae archaeon]
MARKPAVMYRQVKGQAYTRKEYMGGVPNPRINQFDMGNPKEDFPVTVSLCVKNRVQIRHTALEASRIAANRLMSKQVGVANYHLKVKPYPHHVLRENKLATGAGADRVSSGMRHAFGKNVGTAARLEREQEVLTIRCNPQNFGQAKKALWKAAMKLPSPCYIEVEKGRHLLN